MYDFLEINPTAGDVIVGSGGIRKIRWKTGKNAKGKSGGVRVLYHYSNEVLIILITLYAKSNQENISAKDKSQLKKLVPELVKKYSEDINND